MSVFKNSLRRRTFLIMSIMFITLILSIYFVMNIIMLGSIERLEKENTEKNIKIVLNDIDMELGRLSSVAKDWAAWDDSYEFVQNNDEYFIENNLHMETFVNTNINLMAFINNNGEYVFAQEADIDNENFMSVSEDIKKHLIDTAVLYNKDIDYRASGIINLDDGPMLIASFPVITSDFKGPLAGNLVIGRFLDENLISQISDNAKLDILLVKDKKEMGNLLSRFDYKALAGKYFDGRTKDALINMTFNDKDRIIGSALLNDIGGSPAAIINVEIDRDITRIGKDGIDYVIRALIFIGLFIAFSFIIFLDKNILKRLQDLSLHVVKIGDSSGEKYRLPVEAVSDDISILANEINEMLDRLESSEEKLLESHFLLEEKVEKRTNELSVSNEMLKSEIYEREIMQQRITHIAYHDSLTELPNRLLFSDRLNQTILLAHRLKSYAGVIFVDVDEFKVINDTLGHDTGDMLLKEIAIRLKAVVRTDDTVARFGGDEFIILLRNLNKAEDIALVAENIVNAFVKPFKIAERVFNVNISAGCAVYPLDGEDAETLIKNADIAMYSAKENGKGQYALCTAMMKTRVMEVMTISNRLYGALEREEIFLNYQPQVDSITRKITGFEALARWKNPELGLVPPSKFIQAAEQSGLIIQIGEWILRTACYKAKEWEAIGGGGLRMGVNLSLVQIKRTDITGMVKSILDETGLDPALLELEITESIAMNEEKEILDKLHQLKKLGIRISIDDFGTEYSSLQRLKEMPIDRIKIAMPFVQSIDINEKDEAIIKAIISLSKSLDLSTIAEGVETEKQYKFLTQKLCDEIQGYYFFKPMPASEIEALIQQQNENTA